MSNSSITVTPVTGGVAKAAALRRPISNKQPMWIIHIDTWNYPDPQKIIDLIPKDILPYVVFNISLSINWDSDAKDWRIVQYGYETAKSWLKTCADNRVWALIQPASGGQCHFPDYDSGTDYENTVYAEFFRDYPNFLGFNYCEQFWGFDQEDFPVSAQERYEHFAGLLKLSHQYGGYLVVSWCGNQWSPNINPVAMLKRVPDFEEACRKYSENYILCEKYTTQSYQYDMQSLVLGAYLSGYSGQYGIRYDESGWTDSSGENMNYTLATGLSAHMERYLLDGMTVIDGPELIWKSDFTEMPAETDEDGYSVRQWEMYPQFQNVMIDLFRKVLDGTILIPDREEVIKRTKVVIVNDEESGTDDDKYSSPETLFEGLYRMDGDGNLRENKSFFKKTGRYPAIPTVFKLRDSSAKAFQVQVNQTDYDKRWPDLPSKRKEFDSLFPSEYTGDLYAGRNKNRWVVYNPYKSGKNASGSLPFQYNTAGSIDVTLSQYSAGIVREQADSVAVYLNNYDVTLNNTLKTDTVKIRECAREPSWELTDRGISQTPSTVTSDWKNGELTLTVKHNGPLDLLIHCSGKAARRKTEDAGVPVTAPEKPDFYKGARQFEAEFFDCKNIAENITSGAMKGILNYTGQGYMNLGTSVDLSVRDTVHTEKKGVFTFKLKYAVTESEIRAVDLYVNGRKVSSPRLPKTADLNSWSVYEQKITLKSGDNTIELKAHDTLPAPLYLDNFTVEGSFGE